MAENIIVPNPLNMGPQNQAIVGSQGAIFTETDKKIIKERSNDIEPPRTFLAAIADKGLIPEVENNESAINPEGESVGAVGAAAGKDVKGIENRQKEHERMLKNSPIYVVKERVEISQKVPAAPAEIGAPPPSPEKMKQPKDTASLRHETSKIIKELNFNPEEVYQTFALEQDQLHALIYKIRELHLKRFLSSTFEEFDALTKAIGEATLAASRPESRDWVLKQLDLLTRSAAEYKLKLIKSLQAMEFDQEREKSLKWVEKVIRDLSDNA